MFHPLKECEVLGILHPVSNWAYNLKYVFKVFARPFLKLDFSKKMYKLLFYFLNDVFVCCICFDGVVITAQCTATFLRFIVLSRI